MYPKDYYSWRDENLVIHPSTPEERIAYRVREESKRRQELANEQWDCRNRSTDMSYGQMFIAPR